jgi:hypothetical protein
MADFYRSIEIVAIIVDILTILSAGACRHDLWLDHRTAKRNYELRGAAAVVAALLRPY